MQKLRKQIETFIICLVVFFGYGCESAQTLSSSTVRNRIEILAADRISIVPTKICEDDETITVSGRVGLRSGCKTSCSGYMELAAIDRSNKVIWTKQTRCAPSRIPLRSSAYFQFQFDKSPDEKVRFQLRYRIGMPSKPMES